MGKKRSGVSGDPRKRALAAPATGAITLEQVVNFLKYQRSEALRRNEPERWTAYLEETKLNVTMAELVITPGLGNVPSALMREALTQL